MANKYANLVGTNKIKDEYSKINTGFDKVEADINNANSRITAVNNRVDRIITTPIDGRTAAQEVVDARAGFSTIGDRMNKIENDFEAHRANRVYDGDGAHGLRFESGSFTPYITGSTGMGTFAPIYTEQWGWYIKVNNLVTFGLRLTVNSFTGNVSGIFRIGGLPFAPNVRVGLLISHVANMTSDPHVLTAVTVQGQPLLALGKMSANQGVGTFLVTDMGTNFDISITGTYRT